MSKITNLIGTTWRIDASNLVGLSEDYGYFFVDADGVVSVPNSPDSLVLTIAVFLCGYTVDIAYGNIVAAANSIVVSGNGSDNQFTNVGIPLFISGVDYNGVLEFTITGGTDISNAQFIDFINTYGTLVSGGEPPTADSVKSHLQSLLTASNAKTGKSDANLTDAVTTLIEGYGQGGGGECSGKHIIEVDELPEVGVEGAVYGVKTFSDVYAVSDSTNGMIKQQTEADGGTVYLEKTTSEELQDIPSDYSMYLFYLTDYGPDIYSVSRMGQLYSLSAGLGVTFKGEITDTAQAIEQGLYAYMSLTLYQYTNGEFKKLVTEGSGGNGGSASVIGLRKFNSTITTEGLKYSNAVCYSESDNYVSNPQNPIICDVTDNTNNKTYTNASMACLGAFMERGAFFYVFVNYVVDGVQSEPELLYMEQYDIVNGAMPIETLLTNCTINVKDAGKYTDWLLANTTAVE